MNTTTTFGILCNISFLLPVAIIIYYRLYVNVSLLALVMYFLLAITYNLLIENTFDIAEAIKQRFTVINSFLETPLMLTVLILFCTSRVKKNVLLLLIFLYTAYEAFILIQYGLVPEAVQFVLGPGILLILAFSIYLFALYIRITIVHGKGLGKTLMITSILFAYGCYFLVYLFNYIQKTSEEGDVLIIYYISSIVFSAVMSTGLIWVQKRFRQIRELQTTRRELSAFFNS